MTSHPTIDALYDSLVLGDGAAEPRHVARMLAGIPPELRAEPVCRFADAVITRTGDLAAADIAHRRAIDAFAGDSAAACAVMASWLGIALVRRDVDLMLELRRRAGELGESGVAESRCLVTVIDAIGKFVTGDAVGAETMLVAALGDAVPIQARGVIAMVRALALQSRGLLEASVGVLDADAPRLGSFDLAGEMMRARVAWVNGEHARARAMMSKVHADARARGRQHDADTAAATGRLMARYDGDRPDLPTPAASTPWVAAMLALDRALAALPDRAAARELLLTHPNIVVLAPEFLIVPYVLCDEWRQRLEAAFRADDPTGALAAARWHIQSPADAPSTDEIEPALLAVAYRPWIAAPAKVDVAEVAPSSPAPSNAATIESPASQTIQLRVLGAVAIVGPAGEVVVRRERVRALLVALALQRRMTRDRLIDMLWPDLGIDAAANNLRTTLSYARKLVPASSLIRTDGRYVSLDSGVTVDLWSVDAAAGRARQAIATGGDARAFWAQAADAVAGRFAEEVEAGAWLDSARHSVDATSVEVLVEAAATVLPDRPDDARRWAERAIDIDAWCLRAHLLVHAAWEGIGNESAARQAALRVDAVREELGLYDDVVLAAERLTNR